MSCLQQAAPESSLARKWGRPAVLLEWTTYVSTSQPTVCVCGGGGGGGGVCGGPSILLTYG